MGDQQSSLRPRDLLIVALSGFVLLALAAEAVLPLSAEVRSLLDMGDTVACLIFMGDFFYRLWTAPNKLQFLKWGWIDFVTSIPAVDVLRWGRLIRVFRLIRVLRATRGLVSIVHTYKLHRSETAIAGVFLISFLTIMLSSISILIIEAASGGNIQSGGDALWWAVSTITTVGYGDKYPVTPEGRVVAGVLMTVGISLFGALTGLIASWFVKSPASDNGAALDRLEKEVGLLRQELRAGLGSRVS